MGGIRSREAEDVRQAWGRVTRWLERNAPKSAAALCGPATPKMIVDAEARLGVSFPQEMWTWLLTNNGVRMADDEGHYAAPGSSFLPSGWHLLSVAQIVKVCEWRRGLEAMEPSPDPDCETLGWHPDWVPFAVETDWLYGRFIDTGTGMPGRWSDGDLNRFETHDSLADYFHSLADEMRTYGKAEDGRLVW
ncbi:SMI1/KNR4 family protein [Streptomyces sp. NBC_00038]|uniref:SMI1/KNR4 family protein n=1 Tax=Streptomyces sp. NBC_00038 TaxID=2903615 RepID=UPI002254755F|nr:SMI1/KNR4 family protein [Streptomyces sp. NBC_00038]MCX5556299.1 SMI1/KNR4 family protein [Streptomyces sp. NBC_00038]